MGESAPGSQRLGIELGSIYSVPAPCVVHVLLCDLLFLQAKEKKQGLPRGKAMEVWIQEVWKVFALLPDRIEEQWPQYTLRQFQQQTNTAAIDSQCLCDQVCFTLAAELVLDS